MATRRRRYVWVVDRRETRLPFSKFVMASSMATVGVAPEVAYAVAEEVEEQLTDRDSDSISVEGLLSLAAASLHHHHAAEHALRYAEWVEARRVARPILVLLGGASGVGKSSVAAGAGGRLRITTVLPTDAIREVMRHVVPESLAPLLHVSSFEASRTLQAPAPDGHDPVVFAFRQQAEVVGTGIRALIDRSLREGSDLVVEGVHVVPGLFDDYLEEWQERAIVLQAVLTVSDPAVHRAHFLTRLERAPLREPQRYLDHFEEIRSIEGYIAGQARSHGVPPIEVGQLDVAIQGVVSRVVDAVIARREPSPERGAE